MEIAEYLVMRAENVLVDNLRSISKVDEILKINLKCPVRFRLPIMSSFPPIAYFY